MLVRGDSGVAVGYPSTRTVDNFIAALRTKLEEDPANPKHLITAKGQIDDRVDGLDSGADDYLAPPYDSK